MPGFARGAGFLLLALLAVAFALLLVLAIGLVTLGQAAAG